ncbi:Uncharacterised protein [Mycobacteroides abscessus subsp. massiliense]|nr:Uncharacterised protein [Mycobacteroides abscessus subsp. massiliense]
MVEPLERRGVDIPAVEVVLGTQPVQQVDGLGPAALEFDANVAPHRIGVDIQVLDREALPREGLRGGGVDRHGRSHRHGHHKRR